MSRARAGTRHGRHALNACLIRLPRSPPLTATCTSVKLGPSLPACSSSRTFCASALVAATAPTEAGKPAYKALVVPAKSAQDTPLHLLQERLPKAWQRYPIVTDMRGNLVPWNEPTRDIQLHFWSLPDPSQAASLAQDASWEAQGQLRGLAAYWLSAGHVFGAAVQAALPETVLGATPLLSERLHGGAGFSYDFVRGGTPPAGSEPHTPQSAPDAIRSVIRLLQHISSHPRSHLSTEEMDKVSRIFHELVTANVPIQARRMPATDALLLFQGWTHVFKAEWLHAQEPSTPVDVVEIQAEGVSYLDVRPMDEFPLLPSAGYFKALTIPQWSTITWLPESLVLRAEEAGVQEAGEAAGSAQIPQHLMRIRGVAFPDEKQLKSYQAVVKEAAQMDHRIIGREQKLFLSNETTHALSPGSAFMLPHGMRVARKIERVVRDLYDIFGYNEVQTPQLFRSALWKRSGHWDNYRDDMFQAQGFREAQEQAQRLLRATPNSVPERSGCPAHSQAHGEPDADDDSHFGLKPMNCPGHCVMFASRERSYREMPVRMAEFAPLHRNESSGSLSGLTRVRRFHQDDAHVFCRPDQVEGEIQTMLRMLASAYRGFGFDPATRIELVLSTRPAHFLGDIQDWDKAEAALRVALDASGTPWTLNPGDGAFYGPKIDCRLMDAAGRKHQTATIQLDFQLPQRFDLRYQDPAAPGGSTRPVMVHRAILGSVERFLAILIEHTRGRWAFWLSPRQAAVLPVSDTEEIQSYAQYARDYLALGPALARRLQEERSIARKGEGSTLTQDATLPPRPGQVFHVDLEQSGDSLSKMVRRAHGNRVNFAVIVGEHEARSHTVSLRIRGDYAKASLGAQPAAAPDLPVRPRLEQNMGPIPLSELRALFETLDANHW